MRPFAFVLLLGSVVLAQVADQAKSTATNSPALKLLREVADNYSAAKSYWIETVTEETRNQELQKNWSKTYLSAAEAGDGSYRYAGRDAMSDSLIVSDGAKEWRYRTLEKIYTEAPVDKSTSSKNAPVAMSDYAAVRAKFLKKQLKQIATHLKAARFLADENIEVNGESVQCKVITFTTSDFERKTETTDQLTYTVWIDAESKRLVKTRETGKSSMMIAGSSRGVPFDEDRVTLYTRAEINPSFPTEYFRFSPPSDVKQVAKFDDALPDFEKLRDELIDKPAPDVQFETVEGKNLSLKSLRGKPVIIDVWATWCAPCVEAIPEMVKFHAELKSTPFQFLSLDVQDDGSKANDLLRKQGATWINYHDGSGDTGRRFRTPGIPGLVLINSEGKIVYIGNELQELRAAIAKLGPKNEQIANSASDVDTKH